MSQLNTPSFATLNLPRTGQLWQEHHGIFCGITGGHEDRPYCALILPIDPRASFPSVTLGTCGIDVAGAKSLHNGRANTEALAEAGSELCQKILQLEIGGKKDLLLPAAQDLLTLAANVPHLLRRPDWYTSSTTVGSHGAIALDFASGYSTASLKSIASRAIAIRLVALVAPVNQVLYT